LKSAAKSPYWQDFVNLFPLIEQYTIVVIGKYLYAQVVPVVHDNNHVELKSIGSIDLYYKSIAL